MIKATHLKFGRSSGASSESVAGTPIVVFVGPNNSGKSKVLREIRAACTRIVNEPPDILDSMEFDSAIETDAKRLIEHITIERTSRGELLVGKGGNVRSVSEGDLLHVLKEPSWNPPFFIDCFLSSHTAMLDGASRIHMVNPQSAGDFQRPPESSLQVLFRDDARRARVRSIVREAFGTYLVIDPTQPVGQLRLRLSRVAPPSAQVERGLDETSIQFHAQASAIEYASDGVKAFTGIILQMIADDPRVLIIDEPEAFLHPSLSFRLAQEVARAARDEKKHVYVATHSPEFVMGCIQSGAPVTIVRLTYQENVATARVLENNEIIKLMRNPLLRSTGVLAALSYENVVIVESDSDRAFYQEINERLLRENSKRGIPNCLFLNAREKQTVQAILRPLRHLGIPTAAILDLDVLKEGGSVWTSLLSSASIPNIEHAPLGQIRSSVNKAFEMSGKDMKRDGGVSLLNGADAEAAINLIQKLAEYGIFVVPSGELESWLGTLGIAGHGPKWLVDMFQRMGEDEADSEYVRPSENDVWSFLTAIRSWLLKKDRKGIPG